MMLRVGGLAGEFRQVLRVVVDWIFVLMMDYFAPLDWVVRMRPIPNDMRPHPATDPVVTVGAQPTALVVGVSYAGQTDLRPNGWGHPVGGLVGATPATVDRRRPISSPNPSELLAAYRALLRRFHGSIIAERCSPYQAGEVRHRLD